VTNGESDFESRGFTDGYDADYISVQCVVEALMLNTARRTALLVLFLAASVVIIKVPLGLTAEAFSGQKDASPDAE